MKNKLITAQNGGSKVAPASSRSPADSNSLPRQRLPPQPYPLIQGWYPPIVATDVRRFWQPYPLIRRWCQPCYPPRNQPNRMETRLKFPRIQVNPADTSISFPPRIWPSRNNVSPCGQPRFPHFRFSGIQLGCRRRMETSLNPSRPLRPLTPSQAVAGKLRLH